MSRQGLTAFGRRECWKLLLVLGTVDAWMEELGMLTGPS